MVGENEELFRPLGSGPDGMPGGILIMTVGQEVAPNIWLGGYTALESAEFLQKNGISYILSVGHFNPLELPKGMVNKIIPIADHPRANIISIFPDTFDFIDNVLIAGHRILVHCQAGVSRSATVIAAYLMKKQGLRPTEALALIRRTRQNINPNRGFINQLRLYYQMDCTFDPHNPDYLEFLKDNPLNESHAGHESFGGYAIGGANQ